MSAPSPSPSPSSWPASKSSKSLTRILNLNREENEIYVSDSHKSRREREFFLQNLENGEEKENENSIFSSERERARSVFLEISRDSRLLSMSVISSSASALGRVAKKGPFSRSWWSIYLFMRREVLSSGP